MSDPSRPESRAELGALLGELAEKLGHTLGEVIPPEAQVHLLTAQAELLTAIRITLEHHLSSSAMVPPEARHRHKKPRSVRIPVE